jgi:hypothetical protein
MNRLALAALAALGTAAAASAQPYAQPYYPQQYGAPGGFGSQGGFGGPVSPYLNLLRNTNPAVNYYNFTRPGTVGGFGYGLGAPGTASGGFRPPFFPQLVNAPDPLLEPSPDAGPGLPPAGHPTVFNNTLGFYPSPFGNRGAGGRPGLGSIGGTGGTGGTGGAGGSSRPAGR